VARLVLKGHLSGEAIRRRFRAARDTTDRAHWQIVWLVSLGHSGAAVARITGFTGGWVGSVVRRYNELGPESLGDRRHRNRGAQALLSAADVEELRAALTTTPADGGLWTGPKVAAWMGARLGRKVWPQRGWDYLKRLEHSLQVPRPRHAEGASVEERELYKKPRRTGGRTPSRRAGAIGRGVGV
jgi:transposase